MAIYVKPIILGLIFGILTGIIGYFSVAIILSELDFPDFLRSNEAMLWSFPYSFLLLLISGVITTRNLIRGHYLIVIIVALSLCLSYRFTPLKLISIHMNYLPIILGSLSGAFLAKRINKSRQKDGSKAATPA